jgi:NADH-quinone oxidoreductase subunit C
MEPAAIKDLLVEELGSDAVVAWHEEGPEPWALLAPERLAIAARFLRDDPRLDFALLMCLSGIDWDGLDENGKGKSVVILGYNEDGTPQTSDRVAEGDLGVAYHLYSYRHRHKFTVHVRLKRQEAFVPSVADVWPTAQWHEREAWDLLGIRFAGHPDLRRILLDEAWEGHPLRKDYVMPERWQAVPLAGRAYSAGWRAAAGPGGEESDGAGGSGGASEQTGAPDGERA